MSRVRKPNRFMNTAKYDISVTGPSKMIRVHCDGEDYHKATTLSIQPEYHVYNTCIGVGEWPFILSPDLLYSFLRLQVYFHLQLL